MGWAGGALRSGCPGGGRSKGSFWRGGSQKRADGVRFLDTARGRDAEKRRPPGPRFPLSGPVRLSALVRRAGGSGGRGAVRAGLDGGRDGCRDGTPSVRRGSPVDRDGSPDDPDGSPCVSPPGRGGRGAALVDRVSAPERRCGARAGLAGARADRGVAPTDPQGRPRRPPGRRSGRSQAGPEEGRSLPSGPSR